MSNSLGFIKPDAPLGPGAAALAWAHGGIGPFQFAAAPSRRLTTSPTSGRDAILPPQQRSVKTHSESENPMAEAFSGLFGRFPWTT